MTSALWFLAVSWLVFWCGYDWGQRRQAKRIARLMERIETLQEALRATQVRTETHADVPELEHRTVEVINARRISLYYNTDEHARN